MSISVFDPLFPLEAGLQPRGTSAPPAPVGARRAAPQLPAAIHWIPSNAQQNSAQRGSKGSPGAGSPEGRARLQGVGDYSAALS